MTLTKPLNHTCPSTKSEEYQITYNKVASYIVKKLNRGKYKRRPKELKYLHLAKATGTTYKQVRTVMDKLVAQRIVEKFYAATKKNGQLLRVCYYRLY